MNEEEVRQRAFAMPLTSPAYPPGPYRFVDREFMIITYRTDPDALAKAIPAPLEMTDPVVKYEFIRSLAPGDFMNIRRYFEYYGKEGVDVGEFICILIEVMFQSHDYERYPS